MTSTYAVTYDLNNKGLGLCTIHVDVVPVSYTASSRSESRFEHLHKVSFDNVTAYLQKKQQRLEEQQLKRGTAQKANGNKKAKKDTSGAGI